MLPSYIKIWFAARTRRNQERSIKIKLEQIGVEHFVPFRKELRKRKDRSVELWVPVIPNIVFVFTDYHTSLSIVNEYGIKISYLKAMDGKGPLIVPQKQMDDFKLICENNVRYTLTETFAKGDRVIVISGCLTGLEGELMNTHKNNGRVIVRLDGIASFELAISVCDLKKISNA